MGLKQFILSHISTMQPQAKEDILSNLNRESEKWFKTLLPAPGASPDNPSRSLESVNALNKRLDSLGLEEVQLLNLADESNSLFASLAFWKQRHSAGLGPQLIGEKNTDFTVPGAEQIAAIRENYKCPAPAFGGFTTLYLLSMEYRVFLIFTDAIHCVPERDATSPKPLLLFSCCEKFFFRPVVFRHPNPTIGTGDLAANMFPFLGRVLEASLVTDLPQLDIELSLGRDLVKDKIPAFKNKKQFIYNEDESSIVFFGPQGVGKSRTINNILQTSMASITPEVYKLLTCWYWHSFQSEWVEEEIIPWHEDEFEGLERPKQTSIEWGGVDLPKQPRQQGYIVPEGAAFSTTSVNTEIKFGCQFAISFLFHTEEFVGAELASYKRYLTMKERGEIQQEELDDKTQFRRGAVMIGPVGEHPKPSDVKLNDTFANKLGRCVRFCSPHVDVAKSIEFIKSKYAHYGVSDQRVWGLLRSIIIEMPVPLLLGGGRLIDSPGLVTNDNVRREQTMIALDKASAVVYVSSTSEFGSVADEFQRSTFFTNYVRAIAQECLEVMKSGSELPKNVLPKLMFVFNSDKGDYPDSFDDLKTLVDTHLTRLRSKFFESFKGPVLAIVHSLYEKGLPFEEREYLQFVEDSLMSILNPLENPPAQRKVEKKSKSSSLENIFASAFSHPPDAPVAHGRITFMHVLFKYARDKHISPEVAGIPLFLNSLKRILGVSSYRSIGDKGHELMKQINKELKNRLKMENIKDEEYLKKINARLEDIHSKVKRHFKEFENSANELWGVGKRKIVDTEVSKLLELVNQCTGENILENLKQETNLTDQKKLDDLLNRLCRQRGEASGVSLMALALKPLWQGFDATLKTLTELLLPPSAPQLPDNVFDARSISNQLHKLIDRSFAIKKEEDDNIVVLFIELEKKRFTKHIRNALKVFNFTQNFVLEKESLKIFCQQKMELFLESQEKDLKKAAKGVTALREAYLKKNIKEYAEECCKEMQNRLGQRVKLIVENFVAGRNSKPSLKQAVKRAGDGITQRYKKTADEKEIEGLSRLQNYFKGCMLSFYRCMIDNVVEHRRDIHDYVLKAMVEHELGAGKALPAVLDTIEWRNFLNATPHIVDNRWSFLEKKAVVDFSIEVSSKDGDTESNYVAVPTTHFKEINRLLKERYPIANSGVERKQFSVKNLTTQLRSKFLTTKEAKEFFGCYLNVHEDVQKAFFPATINLRNLQLRRLILQKFLEVNAFFDIEPLDDYKRMDMVADINSGLVEIARQNKSDDDVVEILDTDRQLIEAVSLLQLEFETPKKAAEVIDQMLERMQKRLKKRIVAIEAPANNTNQPPAEKKTTASKKRKATEPASEPKSAKKKKLEPKVEKPANATKPKSAKKKQSVRSDDDESHSIKEPKPAPKKKKAVVESEDDTPKRPASSKKKRKSESDDEDDLSFITDEPKSAKKKKIVESDDEDETLATKRPKFAKKKKQIEHEEDGLQRRSQTNTNSNRTNKKSTHGAAPKASSVTKPKTTVAPRKKVVETSSEDDASDDDDFIVNDGDEVSDFIENDEDAVHDEMDYEESAHEESYQTAKKGTKRKRPSIDDSSLSDESSYEEPLLKKRR